MNIMFFYHNSALKIYLFFFLFYWLDIILECDFGRNIANIFDERERPDENEVSKGLVESRFMVC